MSELINEIQKVIKIQLRNKERKRRLKKKEINQLKKKKKRKEGRKEKNKNALACLKIIEKNMFMCKIENQYIMQKIDMMKTKISLSLYTQVTIIDTCMPMHYIDISKTEKSSNVRIIIINEKIKNIVRKKT